METHKLGESLMLDREGRKSQLWVKSLWVPSYRKQGQYILYFVKVYTFLAIHVGPTEKTALVYALIFIS